MQRFLLTVLAATMVGTPALPSLAEDGTSFDGKAAVESDELEQAERREAEKKFKGIIDELENGGLVFKYSTRVTPSGEAPGSVNVYLDNLTVSFDSDWYSRYRSFYQAMKGKKYFSRALANAQRYTSSDQLYLSNQSQTVYFGELKVDLIAESGEVIETVGVRNIRAVNGYGVNHGKGILSLLFSAETAPPVVAPGLSADEAYITVSKANLSHVAKLRVRNPRFSKFRWWSEQDGF